MRLVAIFCLFFPLSAYSQNLYQVVKSSKKGLEIRRTAIVSRNNAELASKVISWRAPNTRMSVSLKRAVVTAQMKQRVCHPTQMAGGYNYLRIASKKLKSFPNWRSIKSNDSYRGAHHVVTQTVIDAIAHEKGIANTTEMKANAPAVYSPLHGDIVYTDLFHDHKRLLKIYHSWGVRGIVVDFFHRLNQAHQEMGLPIYGDDFIKTELLEAELWAKHWRLRWE